MDEPYDLIVSNPPFHDEDVKASGENRSRARAAETLPQEILLKNIPGLLNEGGRLNLIVPHKKEGEWLREAEKNGLFPQRIMRVRGNPQSALKRSLLQLGKHRFEFQVEQLIIERARHDFTDEYQKLTRDFYLKM